MDRDKLIMRLRATFSSELREHVEAFNRELLSLERGGSEASRADSIKTLFRTAHSLKGAARAVNASKLEVVCHNLEELLQGLRDGSRQLTPEIFETLFSAVDTFEAAGREISASLPPSENPPRRPASPVPAKPTPALPKAATPPPSADASPPSAAALPPQAADPGASSSGEPPTAAARAAATAFESIRPTRPAEAAPVTSPAPAVAPAATAKPAATTPVSGAARPATVRTTVTTSTGTSMSIAPGQSSSMPPGAAGSSVPPRAAAEGHVPALGAPPHVSMPTQSSLGPATENISAASTVAHETFLRVPEHKLDSLLAASSELLIARRRIDARQSQLYALRERVTELRAAWEHSGRTPAAPRGGQRRSNTALRFELHALHANDPNRELLNGLERALESYTATFAEDIRTLERAAEALDERIHQVRMLPFVQACDALHRSVRDLAARERKPTELLIRGGGIELDRSIVDGLRAPLLHLVRNAIDHGIESTDERSATSKPARATLTISAALRGDRVEVSVRDDGRGIDLDRIRERIRSNGLPAPVDDQDALRMIFEAGFSTAPAVTDVSGRGVGLDVVRTQIEAMRGSVSVSFESGRYTCFTLTLPLTVTTLRALLLRSGSEVFALPSTSVEKLIRASAEELTQLQGREALLCDGAPLPLVALAEVIAAEGAPPPAAQSKLPVVILGQPGERVALAVDEFIAEQDVVVKPLGKRIRKLRHVSGATLLPSGRIALLLHAGEVLRTALGRVPARRAGGMFQPSLAPPRKRLLLVDDSATTRTLEKSILEAAGYEVITAIDGAQGWELLKEHGADLIVSDVEMPNMSGFELTQTIRSSKRFRETPLILLTSLDSEQDRARGLESGADAYLVKSAFDQTNLLETIRQLL